MNMLTFYEHKDNIPSWVNFVKRVKWNYSIEKFRTYWFINLNDQEKDIVLKAIQKGINHDLNDCYTTGDNIKNLNKNVEKLKLAFAKNHTMMTRQQSRILYDMINYEFPYSIKRSIELSGKTQLPVLDWTYKILGILDEKHSKFISEVAGNFAEETKKKENKTVKLSKPFNATKELEKGSLPKKTTERIHNLIELLEQKKDWNLDSKTQYEVDKITNEYIPEMVKNYVDIAKTNNETHINKVDHSIKKQLSILEKYVDDIFNRFVDNRIYAMNLQHQLLSDKYEKSSLTH